MPEPLKKKNWWENFGAEPAEWKGRLPLLTEMKEGKELWRRPSEPYSPFRAYLPRERYTIPVGTAVPESTDWLTRFQPEKETEMQITPEMRAKSQEIWQGIQFFKRKLGYTDYDIRQMTAGLTSAEQLQEVYDVLQNEVAGLDITAQRQLAERISQATYDDKILSRTLTPQAPPSWFNNIAMEANQYGIPKNVIGQWANLGSQPVTRGETVVSAWQDPATVRSMFEQIDAAKYRFQRGLADTLREQYPEWASIFEAENTKFAEQEGGRFAADEYWANFSGWLLSKPTFMKDFEKQDKEQQKKYPQLYMAYNEAGSNLPFSFWVATTPEAQEYMRLAEEEEMEAALAAPPTTKKTPRWATARG